MRIGVTKEERVMPQDITWDVEVVMQNTPLACGTDNINDTICYDKVAEKIHVLVNQREFHLIEHACYAVYQGLKSMIKEQQLCVTITKHNPYWKKGVSFSITSDTE